MSHYLVTGCFGFIGQYLCQSLAALGEVDGVGHGKLSSDIVIDGCKGRLVDADLNFTTLAALYSSRNFPDTIFHLAGGSSVGAAIENPKRDFDRTVAATADLLEWVRVTCPKTQIIVISSAAVYGAKYNGFISEACSVQPYSPYGYNKYLMEMLCNSYIENYGLEIKIARLFSVYGKYLKKQLLWDLCVKLNNSDGLLELGGTGEEIRDWIHVCNVVEVLIKLSQSPNDTHLVNIGNGEPYKVKDVVSLVLRSWFRAQPTPAIRFNGGMRKGDPFSLISDASLMNNLFDLKRKDLITGIDEYVNWFKSLNSKAEKV